MSDEVMVYNLDDEVLDFRFNSKTYRLDPEAFTKIPAAAIGPMLTQVGDLGAVVVPSELVKSKTKLKAFLDDAESGYVEGTRKWAEAILLDSLKANEDRVKVGLKPIESEEVAAARKWLVGRGFIAK